MDISGKTGVVGLIGWPVAHTFSPQMHNAAARALGLDLVYVPLAVRPGAVAAAVRGLAALGFLGANVTIPHKEAVIPFLDEITGAAQVIGAVNTIQVTGAERARAQMNATGNFDSPSTNRQSLAGANTDWQGFLADLADHEVVVAGRPCVILGAGGGARAVAYGLGQTGAKVEVCARRPAQAQALVNALAPHLPNASLSTRPWIARTKLVSGALIVNTTPVGMHPHQGKSPWPEGASFPKDGFVYDLIYHPVETKFMAQAEAAGCRTANGLGMLLYQGALAFEMWTGIRPDIRIMSAQIKTRRK